MKKFQIVILLMSILFISCDGWNEVECYESVRIEFPDAIEIKQPIGEKWKFIVMDYDSSIYYVQTMNNSNTDVTSKELIFKNK